MSTTKTLRNYRATFLLDMRNYQNPVETLIERLTNVIETVGGTVIKVKNLGQKDFARVTDRKFPAGIYVDVDFSGPSEAPAAIKEKLKLDRAVNRILIATI